MFRLFKKRTERDKKLIEYNQLIKEAYELSKVNRLESNLKTAEAEQLLKKLEELTNT